jgi:hypothetical protein
MSVFAPALGYIWQSAEQYGLNARELFEEAGIDALMSARWTT